MYILKKKKLNSYLKIGLSIILTLIILSIVISIFSPYDPLKANPIERIKPPGSEYLLGTDAVGRDILTRIAKGLQVSLIIAIIVTTTSGISGIIVGVISAYCPRKGKILMRIVDGIMAFPSIILAILLAGILGAGTTNIIIALSISSFPRIARVAYSSTLDIINKEYIESAIVLGKSDLYIIIKYILPNIISRVMVQITYTFAMAILHESILSFLGVGIKVPTPSIGGMVSDGRTYISIAPWTITFPGLTISLIVLGMNMIGDGLREIFDPLSKR